MKRFIALVVRIMMFFLLIEFFIVLWVGNFHLVYFLALISLLGFLFLLYSCGIFLYWFSWWFSVVILCFLFLDLRGANFIDCVPLWIGFCTISFQGRKETFQKFKCFLELSRGGVGRDVHLWGNTAGGGQRWMLLFLLREMFCSWLLKLSCQECAVSSTSKCFACLEFNLNFILRSGF